MSADELTSHGSSSTLHFFSPGPHALPMVPRLVVTAGAPDLLPSFSLSSPSDGSQLSASMEAASEFPAGVAAAQKPPGASMPGGDLGKAPAREITQNFGVILPVGGRWGGGPCPGRLRHWLQHCHGLS